MRRQEVIQVVAATTSRSLHALHTIWLTHSVFWRYDHADRYPA